MDLNKLAKYSLSAADGIPASSGGGFDWRLLHKQHLARLQLAWSQVLVELGFKTLVIHSGSPSLKYSRDDQYWPVVTTPHFSHWAPFEETSALLFFQLDSLPRIYVKRHNSFWESPIRGHTNWDRSSFLWEDVDSFKEVPQPPSAIFIGDDLQVAADLGIPGQQVNRADVLAAADFMRSLKSGYEVACISRANEVAARGHLAAKKMFLEGDHSELAVHHGYLSATSQTDLTVPYGNIVAMGANCGILHHVNYSSEIGARDTSMLVDAGAKFNGYAADVTRTWVRGDGKAAQCFRSIVVGVERIQQELVGRVIVGKQYEQIHNSAHDLLADLLSQVGLIRCDKDVAVNSGITRIFFPHGLGHSLGLQVHDVGMKLKQPAKENIYLRNTSEVTQGQVVTIEPGLYFIPNLLKKAESDGLANHINWDLVGLLLPFGGVRIEDNILATSKGPVNLSAGSPRFSD